MTEREAAEKLKAYHKCQRFQVKGIYEDCNEKLCDNCDLCYAQGNAGEHIKSIEMAIQALEKQIAKKPIFYAHDYYCSVCNSLVGNNEFEWKRFKYCDNCGQAIDWSDVN